MFSWPMDIEIMRNDTPVTDISLHRNPEPIRIVLVRTVAGDFCKRFLFGELLFSYAGVCLIVILSVHIYRIAYYIVNLAGLVPA